MNIKKTIFIALCATLLNNAQTVEKMSPISYDLADLKVLSANKEYIEFFDHMYDLRPSLRDNNWRELVDKNINEFLKKCVELKSYSPKNIEIILKLNKLDLIQTDEILSLYANDLVKGYLYSCTSQGPAGVNNIAKLKCLRDAFTFWQNSNLDDDLALNILESKNYLNGQKDITSVESLEFLKTIDQAKMLTSITEGKNAPVNCAKPFVQTVLFEKLYQIYISDPSIALNFNYFSRNCFNAFKEKVEKLISSTNEIDRKLAYKILESTQELNDHDKQIYSLTYLLTNPDRGDELNNAWATIEELSKDYKSREKILSKIAALDMIPDNLFKGENPVLVKGIISFLASKFPEFIDYYYTQCLAYYQSSEKFPKGTRTLNCREFLEIAKEKSILTKVQINKIKMALPNKNI